MFLRRDPRRMLLEKWNDDVRKVIPAIHFKPITMLMVWPRVLLKIHASASEKIAQCFKHFFIALDKFQVEFRFHYHSTRSKRCRFWISDIDGKAAFAVYQTNYIFWRKFFH